jgi:AraC family transcriptional regulator of adaptative response/methylated-DNA-[protein]-cysteine methyltransferase
MAPPCFLASVLLCRGGVAMTIESDIARRRSGNMTDQAHIDYARVERAIAFIAAHRHDNPSLDDIAAAVHLSPFHFQRLFTKWAGVSPKKFMQFLVLASAKARLRRGASILDAAYGAGLSGGGRLHDLFVNIEAMTPGD